MKIMTISMDSMDTEQACDKIQHPFIINNLGIEGTTQRT